ncbi:hypothetical protein [Mucilaginibacter pocheonensis]|uniref:PH domain-containing protein n=1 Tax=Mucilaginibacter pocheonensis TaxID=398050 RepID=A0ABU1TG46_9SPHI|nr:hypothetical protein [Mucilaginibacter pocheonensis]MDR6944373.1 hypothetical protein [Mucilaginibacter pocheonensis]
MKELSSDKLYYKSLIGLIVGPVLIAAFIGFFWKNNFSDSVVNVSYAVLAIFTINRWIVWFHNKKVYYSGDSLILKNYFGDKSQSISIVDIVNVKFMYNFSVKKERKLIKVSFKSKGNSSYIYFFRNSDKTTLGELLDQIDVKGYQELL